MEKYQKREAEVKTAVAEIIIKVNLFEQKVKEIVSLYINAEKVDFVNDFVLNNLILNANSKIKLLKSLLIIEVLNPDKNYKDFFSAIKNLLQFRNAIAHSDQLIELEPEFNIEFNYEHEIRDSIPFIEYTGDYWLPTISIFNDGKVDEKEFKNILENFNKNYEKVMAEIEEIKNKLFSKNCKTYQRSIRNGWAFLLRKY